jgi:hypothetical protein
VIVGLGAFIISVGGETANFIGVLGITPNLEDHQVCYQVNKRLDVETTILVGVFGILPIVEFHQN